MINILTTIGKAIGRKIASNKKEEKPKTSKPTPKPQVNPLTGRPSVLSQIKAPRVEMPAAPQVGRTALVATQAGTALRNIAQSQIPTRQELDRNLAQARAEITTPTFGPQPKPTLADKTREIIGTLVMKSPQPKSIGEFGQEMLDVPRGHANFLKGITETLGRSQLRENPLTQFTQPSFVKQNNLSQFIRGAQLPDIPRTEYRGSGLGGFIGEIGAPAGVGNIAQKAAPLVGRGFQLGTRAKQAALATGAETGTMALAGQTDNLAGETALTTAANLLFPARTGALKQLKNVPTEAPTPAAAQVLPAGDEIASKVLNNFSDTEMQRRGGLMTESKTSNLKQPSTSSDKNLVPPSKEIETVENLAKEGLKDVRGGFALTNQFNRVIEKVLPPKMYDQFKRDVLMPMNESIAKGQKAYRAVTKELKDVVRAYDLNKKKSAAVQRYGEGVDTIDDLKKQFKPKDIADIVKADKWFRAQYDRFIDAVNKMEKAMGMKVTEKRADYYRHMSELRRGPLGANWAEIAKTKNWKNIWEDIKTGKVFGSSEKMSKKSFQKERKGGPITYDAIGGFQDVLPQYIDVLTYAPTIKRLQSFLKALRKGKENAVARQVPVFTEWLENWTKRIAGQETESAAVQSIKNAPIFQVFMKLDNAASASKVVGSIRTSVNNFLLSQPKAIADLAADGITVNLKAIRDSAKQLVDSPYLKDSAFNLERYSARVGTGVRKGMEGIPSYAKTLIEEVANISDELVIKTYSNIKYNQLRSKGLSHSEAVYEADNWARKIFADRSKIGGVELLHKTLAKPFLRFSTEIFNDLSYLTNDLWRGSKGEVAMRVSTLFGAHWLVNNITEDLFGVRILLDPIDYIADVIEMREDPSDKSLLTRAGARLLGELTAIIPGAPLVEAFIPERFKNEFFGSEGRFAPSLGGLKPIFDFIQGQGLTETALDFFKYGGGQLKKVYQTFKALQEDGSILSKSGEEMGVLESSADVVKSATLGPTTVKSVQEYFNPAKDPTEKERQRSSKETTLKRKELEAFAKDWQDKSREEKEEIVNSITDFEAEYLLKKVKDNKINKAFKQIERSKPNSPERQAILDGLTEEEAEEVLDLRLKKDYKKLVNSSSEVKARFLVRQKNKLKKEEFAELVNDLESKKIINEDVMSMAVNILNLNNNEETF